jgi:hypothetical protein
MSFSKKRMECSNRNCRRTMRGNELVTVRADGAFKVLGCPECHCESTYDLDEPVTNERVDQCNALIKLIASTGRKFFSDKDGFVSSLELAKNGRVLFVDYYSRRRVDTHKREWAGFTSGGTLRNLVELMRDYIKKGEKLPIYFIGLERRDGSNIWGYPEAELKALRIEAAKLPIFEAEVANG